MNRGQAGLVGRDEPQRRLGEAIRADRSIVVIGEPGIGKTALVRAAARDAGRQLHEGGGFATLRWRPYLALERAIGGPVAGDPTEVAAIVERAVGPDVLFIDDLQWVDDSTSAVLPLLVGRILVVAATRIGGQAYGPGPDPLVAAGAEILAIDGLDEAAATAVVQRTRPGLPDSTVRDIVRRAGGNPLLLEELAANGSVPPVLERALTARLADLGPNATALVELLAVAGRPLEGTRAALQPAVAEAIAAGIVIEREGRLDLRHVLVADAIRDSIPAERQRAIHARAAGLLDEPAEVAAQLVAAGEAALAAEVALGAVGAMADPRTRAALLVIGASASSVGTGLDLRIRAARALDEVSDWTGVASILNAADADAGTDEDLAERDALLAHAAFAIGDVAACRAHLSSGRARAIDPTSPAARRLAVEVATAMVNLDGDVAGALAHLGTAAAAVPGGDPDMGVLAAGIRLLASGAGDLHLVRTAADEAFRAGRIRTATDRARIIQYLLVMGVGAEADLAFLVERVERYERAGVGSVAMEFLGDAAVAAFQAGDLGRSIALADEVLERPSPPRARQTAEIWRARSTILLGRFDEAGAAIGRLRTTASPDFLGRGEVLVADAELALWGGRPAVAVQLAGAALEVAAPIPQSHVMPAVTRAWARWEAGLAPGTLPAIPLSPSLGGAVDEVQGFGLLHAGDAAGAVRPFDAAADAWTGFNREHELICRWAAAEAARRAGQREAAVGRLRTLLDQVVAMGFEPLAARARRSLRLAGIRTPASRGAPVAATSLTARERELVGLVEQGLTNIEIARRLGLGRPTVARMVASAMTKLGVERRAQLAARELV